MSKNWFIGGWGAELSREIVSCRACMRAVCMSSDFGVNIYGPGLSLFPFWTRRFSLFLLPSKVLSSFSWLYRVRYCKPSITLARLQASLSMRALKSLDLALDPNGEVMSSPWSCWISVAERHATRPRVLVSSKAAAASSGRKRSDVFVKPPMLSFS